MMTFILAMALVDDPPPARLRARSVMPLLDQRRKLTSKTPVAWNAPNRRGGEGAAETYALVAPGLPTQYSYILWDRDDGGAGGGAAGLMTDGGAAGSALSSSASSAAGGTARAAASGALPGSSPTFLPPPLPGLPPILVPPSPAPPWHLPGTSPALVPGNSPGAPLQPPGTSPAVPGELPGTDEGLLSDSDDPDDWGTGGNPPPDPFVCRKNVRVKIADSKCEHSHKAPDGCKGCKNCDKTIFRRTNHGPVEAAARQALLPQIPPGWQLSGGLETNIQELVFKGPHSGEPRQRIVVFKAIFVGTNLIQPCSVVATVTDERTCLCKPKPPEKPGKEGGGGKGGGGKEGGKSGDPPPPDEPPTRKRVETGGGGGEAPPPSRKVVNTGQRDKPLPAPPPTAPRKTVYTGQRSNSPADRYMDKSLPCPPASQSVAGQVHYHTLNGGQDGVTRALQREGAVE